MQSQPLQEEEMDHLSGQFASSVSMGANAQVKPHREAGWTRWQAPPAAWAGPRNDVGLNALLGRGGKLELANPFQVDMLAGHPEIVGILHGKPTLGRAANRLGQSQGHLRRDPARALEDPAEGGRRHIQLFRELAAADPIGLEIDHGDELTRVWRAVHGHQ